MMLPIRSSLLLSILLGAQVASAAPAVWSEGPTTKIHPSAAVRALAPVTLVGARNEFVPFQVALNGGPSGATNVRARFDGLRGPGEIGGPNVTLYREALISITTPTIKGVGTGRWPDGLVPDVDEIAGEKRSAFPFDVPAGETRAVWVDVLVPMNAKPGMYEGTVEITADGFTASVPVSLEVVDATLPSTPSMVSTWQSWPPHVCRAHTGREDCGGKERAAEILAQYQRMALEHRITLAAFFVLDREGGDWSKFDAAYAPFLDGHAQTRLPGARMTTAEFTSSRDADSFRAWADHFKERGWFDRLYDYTADEPPYHVSFSEVAAMTKAVKDAVPDFRTLVTTTVQELDRNGLTGLVDIVTPVVNLMDGTESPYVGDQRRKYDDFLSREHKDLWLYQSCMSHGCAYGTNAPGNEGDLGWPSYMIDRSAAKNRAMQWLVFLEGASGELYYQTVGMLGTAWQDQYRYNGNGDGTLFLPGTSATIGGTTDVPIASVRLKQIRAGVQDFEWLRLVSDAGDPAFAREVARSVVPAASKVGDDGAAFDRARLRLIERYRELRPTGDPDVPSQPNAPGSSTGSDDRPMTGGEADDSTTTAAGCAVASGSMLAMAGLATLLRRRRASQPAA